MIVEIIVYPSKMMDLMRSVIILISSGVFLTLLCLFLDIHPCISQLSSLI